MATTRKSRANWWEAEEEANGKKAKVNDENAPVHSGDSRDAHEPGGNGTGLWYCGRSLGEDVIPNSDGQCGPYGGPQCPSCLRFQAHQERRNDVGDDLKKLFNLPDENTRLLQDRVRSKVQQILAGRDLSDMTIGALRGVLEEKLSLRKEALQSTKRLRKWVYQVLEHEVLKKSQRSAKCERICRAIADMETYPDNCRRMLMEALPSAMAHPEGLSSGGDPPHPHQVRMLETVQMALQESLDHVLVQTNDMEKRLLDEQAKLTELEQVQQDRASSASAVRATFEAQDKALNMAQEACENARTDVLNAKKTKAEAIASRESLLKEHERFGEVHTTFLQLLEGSTCQDTRPQKLEEVRQCLEAIGTERSLVTAAIAALTKVSGSRSTFEEVSAKAVGKVFAEHDAKLERDLVANAEHAEDGPIELAEVLHDAMMQNAASKMLALADVRQALEEKEALLRSAKKEAKQQATVLSTSRKERDSLEEKSTELGEVVEIVKQLTICIDPPSPVPAEIGTLEEEAQGPEETQDAEGTQDAEEATDVAMALGNDLISAAEGPEAASGSQESSTSVEPSDLQGAFDLAGSEVQSGEQLQTVANEADSDEPAAKRQKLDDAECEVKEEVEGQAVADAPMATADEAGAGELQSGPPSKEVQPSADLQSVMSSRGA